MKLRVDRKLVYAIISSLVSLWFATRQPPAGLTPEAMRAIALLLWAVLAWLGQIAEDYVIALALAVGWIVFEVAPFSVAFNTFSGASWWMILGALGLGTAVARSGLLRRIALRTLLLFPATVPGQSLGLIWTGLLIGPAIPSVIAKMAIAGRLVRGVTEAMQLPRGSRAGAALFFSMFLGFGLAAPMYLTGTLTSLVIIALLPESLVAQLTWTRWYLYSAPVLLGLVALGYLAIRWLFPAGTEQLDRQVLARELAGLGKWSRAEKITAVVLVATLALWTTGSWHGINSTAIALGALAVLLTLGVLDRDAFQTGLGWSSLVFLGIILNLSTIVQHHRVDIYIGQQILPVLAPLTANPYLFALVLALMVYLLRLVMVSYNALTTILMVILMPITNAVGFSPWALGMIIQLAAQATFLMQYQNSVYAVAYQSSGGAVNTPRQASLYSLAFMAATLVAISFAVFLWRAMGLIA
ncbi:MAG: SLC13 family permease [Bacillota bacterium]